MSTITHEVPETAAGHEANELSGGSVYTSPKSIPRSVKTLVLLQGGHTTVLHGVAPTDVERQVSEARLNSVSFLYLHDHAPRGNRVCVDPHAVVGLVRIGEENSVA